MNGNSHEFVNCLDKIYKTHSYIKKAEDKLKDKSIEIAGVEVLRIANKYGKGWLALLVSEQLVYNTYIPNYILKAIAFASGHMNISSKAKALKYRFKNIRRNEKDPSYEHTKKFKIRGKSEKELVKEFSETFKDDQLSKFFSLL